MKLSVAHKANPYRNAILWVFAAAMVVSSIHLGTASAMAFSRYQNESPLSSETYQSTASSLYHDISTSEITGTKNASTILHCAIRNRGRALYHNSYIFEFMEKHTACSLLLMSTVRHIQQTSTDGICTIIRYIHNQDGEKANSNLYNIL